MRSSWSVMIFSDDLTTRWPWNSTCESFGDQDEEALHSIDPLKLLQKSQVEQRVCLAI